VHSQAHLTSMTICQSRSFAKPDHFQVDEFEAYAYFGSAASARTCTNGVAMDISALECSAGSMLMLDLLVEEWTKAPAADQLLNKRKQPRWRKCFGGGWSCRANAVCMHRS
jgi:hypothetical protein